MNQKSVSGKINEHISSHLIAARLFIFSRIFLLHCHATHDDNSLPKRRSDDVSLCGPGVRFRDRLVLGAHGERKPLGEAEHRLLVQHLRTPGGEEE